MASEQRLLASVGRWPTGYIPKVAGHYVQNIGNEDLVMLALFKSDHYSEVSLDQWLGRLPVQISSNTLGSVRPKLRLVDKCGLPWRYRANDRGVSL